MRLLQVSFASLLVFLAACDRRPRVTNEEVLNGFLRGYPIQGRVLEVERHGGLRIASYTFQFKFDEELERGQVLKMGLKIVGDEEERAERWRYFKEDFDLEDERLEDFELHYGIMKSLEVWMFISEDYAMFDAARIM